MDHPSLAEFEAAARREGYDEVAERVWPADAVLETHEHPFAVKAIVVAGEMWLTREGDATRHLRAGDRFELAPLGAARRALRRRRRHLLGGAPAREGLSGGRRLGAQTAMSPDWMRLTPALVILFHAAAERAVEVDAAAGVLDDRRPSKPALRASSAVQATQKSVARPETKTVLMPRAFR